MMSKCYHVHLNELYYSRGQAKPANKNGNLLMREKVTGKRVDALREASGQNSPKSHEPLLRVLFIGLVLLLDLTRSKIAPGVEGY